MSSLAKPMTFESIVSIAMKAAVLAIETFGLSCIWLFRRGSALSRRSLIAAADHEIDGYACAEQSVEHRHYGYSAVVYEARYDEGCDPEEDTGSGKAQAVVSEIAFSEEPDALDHIAKIEGQQGDSETQPVQIPACRYMLCGLSTMSMILSTEPRL